MLLLVFLETQYYWSEEKVESELKEKITASFLKVFNTSERYGVNMKIAAYMVGIQRLAEVSRLRGWLRF